jgi:hypothetical protein
MGRKQKQYHFIYKIINIINEKYYIGMHSTNNLDDGYMGSGYRIRRSIKKYGENNFKREIIEFLPDRSSLKEREKELVNENLLKDPMCMNLCVGGEGGNISKEGVSRGGTNMLKKMWKNDEWRKKQIEKIKNRTKELHQKGKYKNFRFDWTGKKHKEDTKLIIGLKNSIKQKGENNSQYGTMWITNGIENKKIKKESEIPQGWKIGRNLRK